MSAKSPAACVIGFPAKHSRSPKLHGYWLKHYGIDGDYRAEEIAPEQFEAFVTDLPGNGYVGANTTMPHKEEAFRLSEPDAKSKAIGAVNTLWIEGDRLKATNTDGDGYASSVDAVSPGWATRIDNAVVLGAGGAARSIIYALLDRGVKEVHVVNRTSAKAEAMREAFGSSVHPASWADADRLLKETGLLINTTALGMCGQEPLELDLSGMRADAIVSDIVYVPLKTRLLASAQARGLATTDGLAMLLHQAVEGFQLWFGKRPQVTVEQYALMAEDIPKE